MKRETGDALSKNVSLKRRGSGSDKKRSVVVLPNYDAKRTSGCVF
jgi:hypothetical protein